MPQNPSDMKAARDAASKYGRVNWSEYSKLTGTPIPKSSPSSATKETSTQKQMTKRVDNVRRIAGRGRLTDSEYNAIYGKSRRKAAPRKRASAK